MLLFLAAVSWNSLSVLNGIKARIRDAAIPGFQDVTIVSAELGNQAGLYGA
jgi:hypothetical protein